MGGMTGMTGMTPQEIERNTQIAAREACIEILNEVAEGFANYRRVAGQHQLEAAHVFNQLADTAEYCRARAVALQREVNALQAKWSAPPMGGSGGLSPNPNRGS